MTLEDYRKQLQAFLNQSRTASYQDYNLIMNTVNDLSSKLEVLLRASYKYLTVHIDIKTQEYILEFKQY